MKRWWFQALPTVGDLRCHEGLGFRAWGMGLRGLGLGVGFRVRGLEFRVWGLGYPCMRLVSLLPRSHRYSHLKPLDRTGCS